MVGCPGTSPVLGDLTAQAQGSGGRNALTGKLQDFHSLTQTRDKGRSCSVLRDNIKLRDPRGRPWPFNVWLSMTHSASGPHFHRL